MRARGVRPCSCSARSDTTRIAAAASEIWLDTAAVRRPPSTSGGRLAIFSSDRAAARAFVDGDATERQRSRARSGLRRCAVIARVWLSSANCLHLLAGDVPLLGDHLGAAELRHLLGAVAARASPPNRRTGPRSRAARPASIADEIGIMLMFCTPPATTTSVVPLITACAAKCTACCDEPHCRSTVVPGTSSGSPAASQQVRAMSPACGPMVSTQPNTTSSTASGSMPVRSTSAVDRVGAEVGGVDRPPARRPACPRGCGRRRRCRPRASLLLTGVGVTGSRVRHGPGARRRRPTCGKRPCPLHPEVQVVLGRVADGAVAPAAPSGRRAWRRRTRAPWPSTRATRRSGSPSADRPRGPVHERAGELERERARSRGGASPPGTSRSARRTARRSLGVLDRHVEHACWASPTSCAAVPSAPRSKRERSLGRTADGCGRARAPLDVEDAGAHRRPTGAGCTSCRRSGPGGAARRRSSSSASAAAAYGTRLVPGAALSSTSPVATPATWSASERQRDRGVLDDRLGQRGPARLLEQQHEVELVQPEPARGLGRGQADTPIAASAAHAPGSDRRRSSTRRARRSGGHSFVEQVAHRVAERELVVGEGEAHRRYFLGRPSTRSATTLRWISFVPA